MNITTTITGRNQALADTAVVVAALWADGYQPVGTPNIPTFRGHAEFTFQGYTGVVVMNTFDGRVIGLRYRGAEGFDWAIGDIQDDEGLARLDVYALAAARGRAGFTAVENEKYGVGAF